MLWRSSEVTGLSSVPMPLGTADSSYRLDPQQITEPPGSPSSWAWVVFEVMSVVEAVSATIASQIDRGRTFLMVWAAVMCAYLSQ